MSVTTVSSRSIRDSTIVAADIADGAISLAKIGALTTKGDLLGFSTVHARLPVGTNGQLLSSDSTAATGLKWIAASGTGTVTSFSAGDLSPLFTSSVATATTTPALTFAITNQNANIVYAGPTTGGAAAPTFRALVLADLPAGAGSPLTTKGDLYGFSTVNARLPVGTNGHVLTADSTQTLGIKWAPGGAGASPLTTKGDIYTFSTVDAALPVGSNGQVLSADSTQTTGLKWIAAGGTGTVTSVDLTMPGIFSVTGNPVTTTGTLAVALATQNANLVWAGPSSGGAATPTFRALVAGDMPAGFTSGGIVLVYANAAASGAIGSGSSAENDFNKTFTFTSGTLIAGDVYRITIGIDGNSGTSAQNQTLRVYLGTNKIYVPLNPLAPSGTGAFSGFATILFTVRTTGGTGTVDSTGEWVITRNGSSQIPQSNNPTNGTAVVVDTTANAIAKVSYQFSGTNVATNVTLRQFIIEKIGAGT